jgi:hypothetical protein
MSKKPPAIDFDNNWKEVIEKHVEKAVLFFLPNLHPQVDWTRTPIFLEQEMRNIRRKTLKGRKKIVDKLIKVWLKTGEERWILIHIEIESSDTGDFNARMFTYFSRAYDKYDVMIVALALLVGETPPPSYNKFEMKEYGTHVFYAYNAYVVADQNEKDLLASTNIFALFILANLYTIQTKDDMQRRLEMKKKMYELAVERKIPLETMDNLIIFVFQIMTLPLDEEANFKDFYEKNEKKRDMTEAAYQKRKMQTRKTIANMMTKGAYGMNADEMVEQIKEKDNSLKEKDNVLKEKDETLHRLIQYLYATEGKSIEAIAALTKMPLKMIKTIVATYNSEKK